jgi:hypothetical protein
MKAQRHAIQFTVSTTNLATSFSEIANNMGAAERLLLPGALLVAIGSQLLAALMLVDFRLPAFFQ